jgi:hypothetical protein
MTEFGLDWYNENSQEREELTNSLTKLFQGKPIR